MPSPPPSQGPPARLSCPLIHLPTFLKCRLSKCACWLRFALCVYEYMCIYTYRELSHKFTVHVYIYQSIVYVYEYMCIYTCTRYVYVYSHMHRDVHTHTCKQKCLQEALSCTHTQSLSLAHTYIHTFIHKNKLTHFRARYTRTSQPQHNGFPLKHARCTYTYTHTPTYTLTHLNTHI
jgi:hypothetical protein